MATWSTDESSEATLRMLTAESEELAEKRKRAEEKRKKRASFLSNVDEFSQDFETRTLIEENRKREALAQEQARLAAQIKSSSDNYISGPQLSSIDKDMTSDTSTILQSTIIRNGEPIVTTKDNPGDYDDYILEKNKNNDKNNNIHDLTTNLVTSVSTIDTPYSTDKSVFDEEKLSVPNRIGSMRTIPKESKQSLSPISNSSKTKDLVKGGDDMDSDEEGVGDVSQPKFSHFLTREERKILSPEQKIAWKALQADLTNKRKDFHGAVTYAFDGIFSWQMYGSAEAVDEMGKEYTEYLMRCQWGTTWENLQPWIAARRYREFDKLDAELKRRYPNLSHSMPKLPEKDYFRFLESDVIAKRRRNIQEYISVIVSTMPTLLRSPVMDEFLGISDRIATIKSQLSRTENESMNLFITRNNSRLLTNGNSDEQAHHTVSSTMMGSNRDHFGSSSSDNNNDNNSNDDEEGDGGINNNNRNGGGMISDQILIFTVEEAETYKIKTGAIPLDEDKLGSLEENLRILTSLLMGVSSKNEIGPGSKIRKLLALCTQTWPQLRSTCELGSSVDFVLIPRAMQAEDDLLKCIGYYKSVIAVHSLS